MIHDANQNEPSPDRYVVNPPLSTKWREIFREFIRNLPAVLRGERPTLKRWPPAQGFRR